MCEHVFPVREKRKGNTDLTSERGGGAEGQQRRHTCVGEERVAGPHHLPHECGEECPSDKHFEQTSRS